MSGSLAGLAIPGVAEVVEEILHDACWWLAVRSGQFAVRTVLMVDARRTDRESRSQAAARMPIPRSGAG
jgi:hypothetical protein